MTLPRRRDDEGCVPRRGCRGSRVGTAVPAGRTSIAENVESLRVLVDG